MISGTPRQNSIKTIEKIRISGIVERRPSASAIPIGIEATMPVTETTSVTNRPPHSRVSTTGNPPRSSPITAITMPMPAKIARLTDSERHPRPMPPPSKNSSSETTAAVTAKSIQTGRLDA